MAEKVAISTAEIETMVDEAFERALAKRSDGQASVESLLPAAVADNSPVLSVAMLQGEPEGLLIELGELFVGGFTANAATEEQRVALEPLDVDPGTGQIDDILAGDDSDTEAVTANAVDSDGTIDMDAVDVGTGMFDDDELY